ncbi:MAG: hypothetical protein LN414_02790 [Candidatus Thermoplasmatota archaeon]|nr:hypothetical protein [Candidatus Thermoplasmatota archaeon]
MRRHGVYLRRPFRGDDRGAAASIATVLLVVLVVAMITVVGVFVFTITRMPDEPPDIKVSFHQLNDRWTASITYSRDPVPLRQLRLIARTEGHSYAMYDSDGDGLKDAVMVSKMDALAVISGDGPQLTPMVFVDADDDGNLTVGDSIVVYEFYYFPLGPIMDADRGYAMVGPNPDGIPRNSTLKLVASPLTLGNPDIHLGDTVRIEIKQGASTIAIQQGTASLSGTYVDEWHIPIGLSTGSYDANFIIRPGEIDEWILTYSFRILTESPITPAEAEQYHSTTHPFNPDDTVQLIHIPSNSVALEFRL